ncbi:GNAT superfamily N-acetyltransferase [Sagittula marina]|uniref:GNAT superfamily N-acetyltransferase n=1 Tax=Sagittula marina TaxID=943940 RepID=A0A7W6DK92_9RHOB|nr:GNAT family N-acetyltransferase [Sagittula marina]MBB3984593.1 GNAT superfamily N-acetyltransferase [Sagittula marina]
MLEVTRLTGEALDAALPELARLRIDVFRAFPYLYEGDLAYESKYLRSYRQNQNAILVAVRDDDRIVGAATGMPLADHADASELTGPMPPVEKIFYCAESVLLPEYRGHGLGHAFFDAREAEARRQGFDYTLFCGVVRSEDHPDRPEGYRPLDAFWRNRGYAKADGVTATFCWTDLGNRDETPHLLQAWIRQLD